MLIHCKAGRHRAATLAAVAICYLKGCTFKTAEKDIRYERNSVEINKAVRKSGWQDFVAAEERAALQSRISAKFIQWKTHGEQRIHTMNHHSSTRSICHMRLRHQLRTIRYGNGRRHLPQQGVRVPVLR